MPFRILPGQRVKSNTVNVVTGRLVSRSFLKPDRIKVRFDPDGHEAETNDSDYFAIPDPGNVPLIIVKAIIAKAKSERWSRARLMDELTRYADRVLGGSES